MTLALRCRCLKRLELEIDASGVVVGAVINQDGSHVAFESKKLSPAQQKWHVP